MCVKHLYRFKTSDFFLSVSWLGIPKNFCCSSHCRGHSISLGLCPRKLPVKWDIKLGQLDVPATPSFQLFADVARG